ncbi:Nn.00g077330.m01.CDS01 [Neocucurbitaria sp. VM-36]
MCSPPAQADGIGNPATSDPSSASPSSLSSSAGWPKEMTDAPSIFTPPSSMPHQTMDWCFPDYPGLLESMSTSAVDKDDFMSSLPSLPQPLSQLLSVSPPPSLLDDDLTINLDSFLFQSPMGTRDNSFQNYDKTGVSMEDVCRTGLTGADINNDTPMPSGYRRSAGTPTDSIDWFAIADAPNNSSFVPTSDVSAAKVCSLPSPPASHDKSFSRGCLARCLCLLDQLTPQWTIAPCTQDANEKNSMPTSASFESVIEQNQAAVDAVDEILKCPCSRNSVLLFALALVMFKMLGWYTACVNATPQAPGEHDSDDSEPMMRTSSIGRRPSIVRRPSQSTMLDYEMDVDYEDRIVCQIVLSRLYSVRRTLNVLTERLTVTEEKHDTPNSSTERVSASTENLLLHGPAFDSSSPSNLGQSLANNLRSHLHDLCESIVETLSAI